MRCASRQEKNNRRRGPLYASGAIVPRLRRLGAGEGGNLRVDGALADAGRIASRRPVAYDVAHVLARGGREVTPEPKPVCFSKIERLTNIDEEGRVAFRVYCRKGTYIRSFARDLGARLGSAAHVSALARTACGPFRIEASKGAEELFSMTAEELSREATPVPELETPCAAYDADDAVFAALSCGRPAVLSALTRLSFGAEPRPDSPAVIKSNKIFSICRAAKKGGALELSPDVNIILSGGLK